MSSMHYKRGDRLPTLEVVLWDGATDAAAVLTGATAKVILRLVGESTAKVSAAATITDALLGQVRYSWGVTDLDTIGSYYVECEVTYASGGKRTFPSSGYLTLLVEDDLG